MGVLGPKSNDPSDLIGFKVRSMPRRAAADWYLLSLGHHFLGDLVRPS